MDQEERVDDLEGLPPQEKVAAVFRLAGYEVEQRVGTAPGTIDWFAVARTGFVRTRTLFRALPHPPESPDAVLDGLEAARAATGADRAIAVVMEGGLPSGYEPDLARIASNLLTFRRWFLEVSGVADAMRETVRREESPTLYLPRRARLSSGEEVQVEPFLDEWSQAERGPTVAIQGGKYSGKDTVLYFTVYRAALRYMERPETTRLLSTGDDALTERAIGLGFVLPAIPSRLAEEARLDRRSLVVWGQALATRLEEDPDALDAGAVTLRLIEPQDDEIELWYERHLSNATLYHLLREARRSNADFSALTRRLPDLSLFLHAIRAQEGLEAEAASGDAWIAAVMISYLRRIESKMESDDADEQWTLMEDLAMREFALGSLREDVEDIAIADVLAHSWLDGDKRVFRSELVRDLFLSKKIIREILAGNEAFLFRHQFPRWTLLYLTLLAPEVTARLTGGAIGRMEQKIQEEVERKLELTFAHILNRPVGAMRQCLAEIQEGLDPEQRDALARPLARMEAEVDYVANLAEKTRLWRDDPSGVRSAVHLRTFAEEVLRPLRQQHPSVHADLQVDADLRVNALPDALREAVHCLLENAFHAALASSRASSPRVTLRAYRLGESVRLEIRDNGDGVPPADRERIFDPLVTTKTGGSGKPRGTGLGLAIARRYVECMGGRVALDPTSDETCFFVDLVAWRDDLMMMRRREDG
ncbi:MAG TPA: HAMP domain-containing sensor histidine kinase [Candidatus Nanopelagicales bacterium]|nr:HAMP domain-containing sensor histidine kinase [Candidatus Nanopelagicales bacterium]